MVEDPKQADDTLVKRTIKLRKSFPDLILKFDIMESF